MKDSALKMAAHPMPEGAGILPQTTIQELQARLLELEKENDELRAAQAKLEAERSHDFDLYNQSPGGSSTVSNQGRRTELSDITARKGLESGLARAYERVSLVTSSLGVYDLNIQTGEGLVSPEYFRMLGYDPAEFQESQEKWLYQTGVNWQERIHPEDRAGVSHTLAGYTAGERESHCIEYRQQTKGGEWKWILSTGRLVSFSDDAEPCHLVGTHTDITARKRDEERLLHLSTAVEQSPVSIVVTNRAGEIEYVNPKFCAVSGYTREEVLGKKPSILKSGDMSPERYKELWETLMAGGEWRGEFHNRKKSGELYWESVCISPLRDASGQISNFIGVKEDITIRKRTEEELRTTSRQLEDVTIRARMANAAKSEFLTNMSHEIRTPMNGVLGMAELLLDTDLDHQQQRYLRTLHSSGESMIDLINSVLDFSKIESDNLSLEVLEFDLPRMLGEFARTMAVKSDKKGLLLTCGSDSAVPAALCGDPVRLSQILKCLTENAIKFSSSGEVSVRVSVVEEREKDVCLRFSVRDTGIGIPKDKIGTMFEKFTQADTSSTRKYGGAGLGLAISKQLVDLMGGEIGVESEEGKGTEIWFDVSLGRQLGPEKCQDSCANLCENRDSTPP